MQTIHSTFSEFKDKFFPQVELEAHIWNFNFECEDAIYFLKHYSHCFILFFHERRIGYIADGEYMFNTGSGVSKSLRTDPDKFKGDANPGNKQLPIIVAAQP